jgi:hypothetical protein
MYDKVSRFQQALEWLCDECILLCTINFKNTMTNISPEFLRWSQNVCKMRTIDIDN